MCVFSGNFYSILAVYCVVIPHEHLYNMARPKKHIAMRREFCRRAAQASKAARSHLPPPPPPPPPTPPAATSAQKRKSLFVKEQEEKPQGPDRRRVILDEENVEELVGKFCVKIVLQTDLL